MASQVEERAARIKAVRDKSLKLMKMDSQMNSILEGKRETINDSINSSGNLMENAPMQTGGQMQHNPTREFNFSRMSPAAGNVPSVIRESFQSQPPSAGNGGASVLDAVFGDAVLTEQTVPTINETSQKPVQQVVQQYPSQIDYPMIRTIVEEIVRKYTVSLSKKLMTEGKQIPNQVNTIAFGDTFKFLDNDGNIFEAKLIKKGNIKNKKSVNG